MLHGKQISVQMSADEKKKSTDKADTGPNNSISNSSLSSKETEKDQSGNSAEQQESRNRKKMEQKEERFQTTVTDQDFRLKDDSINALLDDASTKTYINSDIT